jgi:hypothetical protein
MLKTWAASLLLTAGTSLACSLVDVTYRTDTISPGSVQVVATTWTFTQTSPPKRVASAQTIYGPYHQVDLESHLESALTDSALVFIGRIDSLVYDSTAVLSPEIALTSAYTGQGAIHAWVRARFQVDTLLRGSLPGQTFWVKTAMLNSALCGSGWEGFLNKSFLNTSNALTTSTDIKLPYQFGGFYNATYWFDGRYLMAPNFPGLRADITDLDPTFPATSIMVPRKQITPMRLNGNAYLPDGRVAPLVEGATRKVPVPLLK